MRSYIVSISVALVLLVGYCLSGIEDCHAAVPGKINYQGKLTDADEKLVSDGSYDIVFSIHDAESGGNEEWSETHNDVQVTNGIFNVLLGSTSDLTPVFQQNDSLYLEISVEGETLSPRQQVVSSGFALMAGKAGSVSDGAITTDSLADDAVTADKIGTDAVTADKINVPGLDSSGNVTFTVPTVSGIYPDSKVE